MHFYWNFMAKMCNNIYFRHKLVYFNFLNWKNDPESNFVSDFFLNRFFLCNFYNSFIILFKRIVGRSYNRTQGSEDSANQRPVGRRNHHRQAVSGQHRSHHHHQWHPRANPERPVSAPIDVSDPPSSPLFLFLLFFF